jgi:hypothetical protein
MGLLSYYFSAPSDETAARAIDIDTDLDEPPYDVLQMKNLVPDHHLEPVEVFLTGRNAKAVKDNPRSGMVLAEADDDGAVVMTLSDEFTAGLAAASDGLLGEAAESWSRSGVALEGTDTPGLAVILGDLASLARRAAARNDRLYCYLCF